MIPCKREHHDKPTPADALISWPDGPFTPTTACFADLEDVIHDSLDEGRAVVIEPIDEAVVGNRPGYEATTAVKEVIRLHRRGRGGPVRAILLEAPDMPGYDELPETLEEREKLPARFHVPCWDGNGKPNLWICAVCWDEGTVSQWPCKVASEQGGEVFAR